MDINQKCLKMQKIKLFGIMMCSLVTTLSFAQKTKTLKLDIKPNTVSCTGVAPQECMQVKFNGDKEYQLFYDKIQGFNFEKGYEYKIKVVRTEIKNPPADGSKYTYKLKKVTSKKAVVVKNYADKKMFVTKLNGKTIDNKNLYLTIDSNSKTIYGNSACNRFNISYTEDKGLIKTKSGIGTMMACEQASMNLESEFMDAIQNQTFKITQVGNTYILTNQSTKKTIEVTQPTQADIWSYIGVSKWKLIQLENVGMDYDKAFIQFDPVSKRVNGNSGCNNFFGEFTSTTNNISFSKLGSTKMGCLSTEKQETERKVLNYLGKASLTYDITGNTLKFYDGDRLAMVFSKQE